MLIFKLIYSKEIWVSTIGNDQTGDGSITKPYRHISYSIKTSINGDNIYVKSGDYFENVIWNKTVTITGSGTHNPSLYGTFIIAEGKYTGLMFKNFDIKNQECMLNFNNNVEFENVKWENINFFLNGDTTFTNSFFCGSKILISSFHIKDSIFSTSNYENQNGALFGFKLIDNSKGFIFENLYVEGYDKKSNQSCQINICCGIQEVEIFNSRTENGGNFYICNVDGLLIHNNIFKHAPGFGIDNVKNSDIYENEFIDCGKYKIESIIPDDKDHAGGIGILGEEENSEIINIQIRNNKFTGKVRSSSILVNRFKTPPNNLNFKDVKIFNNLFLEITDDEVFAIDLQFNGITVTANENYWDSPNGPAICSISSNKCKEKDKKIAVRGNVLISNWYCTKDKKIKTTDGSNCNNGNLGNSTEYALIFGLGTPLFITISLLFFIYFKNKKQKIDVHKEVLLAPPPLNTTWTQVLSDEDD